MTIDARIYKFLVRMFRSGWFWASVVALSLIAVFTYETFNQDVMERLNPAIWVMTNLIYFFGAFALNFYVLLYGISFEWRQNEGGRLIFALTLFLALLVDRSILIVFFFPTTGRAWYQAPPEPVFWLPTLSFIIYAGLVTTVVSMSARLIRNFIAAQPVEVKVPPRVSKDQPASRPGRQG